MTETSSSGTIACSACSQAMPADSNICPYCGYIYKLDTGPAERTRVRERSMLITIAAIVIGIIVVQIVLYWVMFFGLYGGDEIPPVSPVSLYIEEIANGVQVTFQSVRTETRWSDVLIELQDASNTVFWLPSSKNLDDGTRVTYHFPPQTLTSITVWLNLTDLTGNGKIDQGDFFTIATPSSPTFDPNTYYYLDVSDKENGWMVGTSFQG